MNELRFSPTIGKYVSHAFYDYIEKVNTMQEKQTKKSLDLTKCDIVITEEHYFYLYYKGRRIKELSLQEYWKLRNYVNEIIERNDQE